MKITLLEPFFTGSHQAWAEGFQKHSKHDISILSLKGRHWKWRMHGGAVTLARKYLDIKGHPDLLLATSMLDLTTFLALTRSHNSGIPVAFYFHENQLTYPWSEQDPDVKGRQDRHYGFINYTSALAADRVFFNSAFHQDSFLTALRAYLKVLPEHVDEEFHPARFYTNFEELCIKVEALIRGNFYKKVPEELRNGVERYDWNRLGTQYDEAIDFKKWD